MTPRKSNEHFVRFTCSIPAHWDVEVGGDGFSQGAGRHCTHLGAVHPYCL